MERLVGGATRVGDVIVKGAGERSVGGVAMS